MTQVQPDILITDLPARVVGGFIPAAGVGEGWIAVDYQTPDFNGIGLATGYDSGATELTLRLDLEGEYVLYLAGGCYDTVRVWLDGEEGFRELQFGHGGHRFMEARLHRADLTGRNLHIAPLPASRYRDTDAHTFISYLRAVRDDYAPKESARNLVATNDGYSWIALDGMESVRDVSKFFAPYRDSDFYRMLWNTTGADVSGNHLTKVGTVLPFDCTHAYRRCDRQYAETTKRILEGGGDILAQAVASAREVGMELHFYIRPEAFFAPFPYNGVYTSQFLAQHPEWRCRDEFGDEIMRMSYAYPEVQDHMLAYIEELLGYDPDGICFAFNRSLPMLIAEEPVLTAYRERYGRAPKLPEEFDTPEMQAIRQEILTRFVERLHALLASRGKVFSAILDHDNTYNLSMGLNIETLFRRGLMEAVYTTGYAPQSDFWARMRDAYPVKIYSSVHYGHEPGLEAPKPFDHQWQAGALKSVLAAGFAGSWYWDTECMHGNPYNWHVLRHGGTPAFLDRVIAGDPEVQVRFQNNTETMGVKRGKYDPMRSY